MFRIAIRDCQCPLEPVKFFLEKGFVSVRDELTKESPLQALC